MTYEDRIRHQQLVERSTALQERLGEGEGRAPVTRDEARELAALVGQLVEQLSPERWDRVMETVVDEATRRAAGAMMTPLR